MSAAASGAAPTSGVDAASGAEDRRFLVLPHQQVLPAAYARFILRDTPSRADGLTKDAEAVMRVFAAELIQELVLLLRLPMRVACVAQVLMHRFYLRRSFVSFDAVTTVAAVVWLALKLEEEQRSAYDLLAVLDASARDRQRLEPRTYPRHSGAAYDAKQAMLQRELHVLKDCGFVTGVELPHKYLLNYCKLLAQPGLAQSAWGFANDALRTTLCLQYPAATIACSCVFMAARFARVKLPDNPPYWELFDVSLPDMQAVSASVLAVYQLPHHRWIDVAAMQQLFGLSVAQSRLQPGVYPAGLGVDTVDRHPQQVSGRDRGLPTSDRSNGDRVHERIWVHGDCAQEPLQDDCDRENVDNRDRSREHIRDVDSRAHERSRDNRDRAHERSRDNHDHSRERTRDSSDYRVRDRDRYRSDRDSDRHRRDQRHGRRDDRRRPRHHDHGSDRDAKRYRRR